MTGWGVNTAQHARDEVPSRHLCKRMAGDRWLRGSRVVVFLVVSIPTKFLKLAPAKR